MADDTHKNFWATLPGLLTGTASLITAVLALLTFSTAHCDRAKSTPAPGIVNLTGCKEIAGDWDWFTGGVVTLTPEGGVSWKQDPANPASLSALGRWTCLDTKPRTYSISWQNGFTDNLSISPDGRSVSGTSQPTGIRVTGTRR